jgi:hypothetical protein
VAISNRDGAATSVRLLYQPSKDVVLQKGFELAGRGTLLLEDVVASAFGAGDGRGALRLEVLSKAPPPITVAARVYAERSFGNFGQGMPAVAAPAAGTFYLTGLRHDDEYRSNIGVTAAEDPLQATFALLRGGDGVVAEGVERYLLPGEQKQWSLDGLFPPQLLPAAALTVEVTLSAPGIAFASLVDNVSTDAVTLMGKEPSPDWIIPVVAHNPGKEGTFWSSSVGLCNPGDGAAVVELEYLPERQDNSQGGLVTPGVLLGQGETLELEDVVLSQYGIEDGKGELLVRSSAPVVVASRIFTAADVGGTTGHGVEAVPPEAIAEGELVLPGVRLAAGFRTNVAVLTGEGWTGFRIVLRDADGSVLGERTPLVPPRTIRQWGVETLFGPDIDDPAPSGSISIDADGPFLAYLVVVDGSSQDPAFFMPIE